LGCETLNLTRPLQGAWPYLWLGATYLRVREGGRIVSRAVIIAFAVNEDGKREVPGVATEPSDDHKGLRAAARRVGAEVVRGGLEHRRDPLSEPFAQAGDRVGRGHRRQHARGQRGLLAGTGATPGNRGRP
jgi:hypothetical protein